MNLTLETNFYAYKMNLLSSDDIKTLTLLYLPIIEIKAYSLYMCLINLVNIEKGVSKKYSFNFISKILNLNAEEIDLARKKLDIVGLLQTYKYTDEKLGEDVILFKINSPLSANMFIENDTFTIHIENFMGDKDYHKIIERFNKEFIKNAKTNITEMNKSILFVDNLEKKNRYLNMLNQDKRINMEIEFTFNKEKFIEALEKYGVALKFNYLDDINYLTDLKSLCFSYSLNEEKLAQIFKELVEAEKYPTIEKIKNKILLLKYTNIYYKTSDDKVANVFDKMDIENLFDTLKQTLDVEELSDIKKENIRFFIQENFRYPRGLLFTVVFFSNKLKNEKNGPFKGYYNKVLINIIEKYGIISTEQAFVYFNLIIENKKRNEENIKNYYNNMNYNKKNQNTSYSKEEQDKFIERLNKDIDTEKLLKELGVDINNLD